MAAPRSDGLIVGGDLLRQFAEVDPALHFFVQLGLNGCFFLQQGRQTDVIADRGVYGGLRVPQPRLEDGDIRVDGVVFPLLAERKPRFFRLILRGPGFLFRLGGREGASSSRRSR